MIANDLGVSGRALQPTEAWERRGAPEPTPNMLGRALAIAYEVHQNQTDKAGAPYILHPVRVMVRMTDRHATLVALLHDVVEDSGGTWTLERLRSEGFPDEVVSAVDALTRREEETYDAFVARAMSDPIARAVKLADLEDNMDIRRLESLDDGDIDRLRWYHRIWQGHAKAVMT